jgi:hypothetical protein
MAGSGAVLRRRTTLMDDVKPSDCSNSLREPVPQNTGDAELAGRGFIEKLTEFKHLSRTQTKTHKVGLFPYK